MRPSIQPIYNTIKSPAFLWGAAALGATVLATSLLTPYAGLAIGSMVLGAAGMSDVEGTRSQRTKAMVAGSIAAGFVSTAALDFYKRNWVDGITGLTPDVIRTVETACLPSIRPQTSFTVQRRGAQGDVLATITALDRQATEGGSYIAATVETTQRFKDIVTGEPVTNPPRRITIPLPPYNSDKCHPLPGKVTLG